ncbi:MAG TPA: protein kinase, partial [Thermoanaerobaculia bacterium]|nr:protein kinase [Thermoanaerobaculia bacterium]
MRLQPGMRLGPYRIERRAGSGGMGEVYRARDVRLARSVAIKVLSAEIAADARQRARLEQEARAISALNHPHICALHDLGREGDLDYLVLELCEGQTLAERLDRGALPLEQVLRYGIEIAGALSAAHRAGIVHRDLKPSNIMLTGSGVKLLDFGISSPRRPPHGETDAHATTSFWPAMTEEGRQPGTLQYMAPEVLNGEEADARTDIFALGAVLYEMLTGKRAFAGAHRAGIIAAILEREPPPLREARPDTPPALESAIVRCLAKRREERWESAHDLSEMLRLIPRLDAPAGPPSRRRTLLAAGGIAVLASMAWVAGIERARHAGDEARVVRLSIPVNVPVPENNVEAWVGDEWGGSPVAITADGKRVAYTVIGPSSMIYLRSLDSADSRPVEATELAGLPFFSPDGGWLGFFNSGVLSKVPVGGGAPQVITTPAVARGASWGSDGNIYFTVSAGGGLWRVAEKGGPPRQLTTPDGAAGENSHRWPQLLPDREHVLFTIRTRRITSYDDASIAVLSLATGKWKVVLEGGTYGQYAATG